MERMYLLLLGRRLTVKQTLPEHQPDPAGRTPVLLRALKLANVQAAQKPSFSYPHSVKKETSMICGMDTLN